MKSYLYVYFYFHCRHPDWENEIPYEFDDTFTNPKHIVLVKTALAEIKKAAQCLNFVDVTKNDDKPKSLIRLCQSHVIYSLAICYCSYVH